MILPTSKRVQCIVDALQKQGYVKASELSQLFSVSMETIRKDLTFLEEKGVAKREYGGASLSLSSVERSLDYRRYKEEEKKAIARCVCTLLKEHHSVILDAGSTCLACASYINLLPSMDIVTNSTAAFTQLNGDVHNVFLCGGKKREKNQSLVGQWARQYLSQVRVDVCLLGSSGLLGSPGPTSHSYQELEMKQAMIAQSDMVFVVVDSSKFLEKGFHTICEWDEVDAIVSDQNLSPAIYEEYIKKVPIYLAQESVNEENS